MLSVQVDRMSAPRYRLARIVNRAHLDIEPARHLFCERFAVRRGRAVDLAQPDVAHALEGVEKRARHAARAEHANDMRILAGEIFHADAGTAADAKVLQHAIVDEGERLTVAGRHQEDQAAIGPGLAAVFILGPVAVTVRRPGDNVGLHADGEIAVVRAFHGAPAEIAVLALAGEVHVDARPMDGAAGGELAEGLLLHSDAIIHGEQLRDEVVVNEKHRQGPVKLVGGSLAVPAGSRNVLTRDNGSLDHFPLPR
jgi:hypothetical protein